MISETAFQVCADILKVPVAAVKAVAEVESGGAGMIDGKPTILFEPHIYYKQLKKAGIDPARHKKGNEDIIYPVWGTKPYPKGQAAQWARLDRASAIHRNAALQSCSWGKFQVCGFNYSSCGCATVQDFVNAMFAGEDQHLKLFTAYIRSEGLDDELRHRDWKGFAAGYNGPLYLRNAYHVKMAKAYQSFV